MLKNKIIMLTNVGFIQVFGFNDNSTI